MQIPPSYTLIMGLGESGFSCIHYLADRNESIVVADSRESPPKLDQFKSQFPNIPVFTGGFPADVLRNAKSIIISPGIAVDHPDIKKHTANIEIIGDIELFARTIQDTKTPVIAITGSNGKSTVTTLVGEMASNAGISVGVGGNLGTPALSLLQKHPALYVLELSSFQLETTYSLRPAVATLLNLSPDHLDRYPTVEHYHAAKQRIFNHCEKAVINRDDPYSSRGIPKGTPIFSFGLKEPKAGEYGLSHYQKQMWIMKGKTPLLPVSSLKVFGKHNVANVMAALAIGDCAGFPVESMIKTAQLFTGLAHRCEWVREKQGVVWINDSKGTNVGASISALQGLKNDISGKWVLIAGGEGKNADFSPLIPVVKECCRKVVLIGKEANHLHSLLGTVVPCQKANSLNEAIQYANQEAAAGDGVLLSPACASFDMFKNFEERGNLFKEAVKGLT